MTAADVKVGDTIKVKSWCYDCVGTVSRIEVTERQVDRAGLVKDYTFFYLNERRGRECKLCTISATHYTEITKVH